MVDVVVLGGGPAGITAALRARELGASVTLVERDRLGGTCTNDGCVPTRVLAKAARLMRDSDQFSQYGLRLNGRPVVDFAAVMQRTRDVVEHIHQKKALVQQLEHVGVQVIVPAGDTRFVGPNTLRLADGTEVHGDRFILCVGGHARALPFPGAEYALTSSTVWDLASAPARVAIIGGGATGCQLASVMEDFGARVTILELAERILVTEDRAVSDEMARLFTQRGIQIMTGLDTITRIDRADDGLHLHYEAAGLAQQLDVEVVIASIGWLGNSDALGLDQAGVATERSYVVVDDTLQTSASHIYAAGDITGRSMLVQSASAQARIAVENALLPYRQRSLEQLVPHGGFTDPEYGGVGLTEAEARRHYDVVAATVPYRHLDRAIIDDRRAGFCKLIADRRTGSILGVHVVGEHAVEIVSMVSAGMASDLHVQRLAELELAYPTFVAIVGLAARQVVREMGLVPLVSEWRELRHGMGAEWEIASEGRSVGGEA
jgi:pyruvate/2-oxoglutarate dehydrogenase complex dihydrolipoamide dehydrogenase (E3) component